MRIRIGTDLDCVIADFDKAYAQRFDAEHNPEVLQSKNITKNVNTILINERSFWVEMPVLNRPEFEVELYCTRRVNPKSWTKEFLKRNNMPVAKRGLYQTTGVKSPLIKGRIDVFIDDSVQNFIELNKNGVCCLLYRTELNESWGDEGVINSLDYETIKKAYYDFKNTWFDQFDELVNTKENIKNLY